MSSRAQRSNLAFFRAAGQRGWAGVLALCFCSCFAQSDLRAAQEALDRQDYPAALRAFVAMAEAGDGLAKSSLGMMHERGMGTPADNAKALYWLTLALSCCKATPGRFIIYKCVENTLTKRNDPSTTVA